MINNLNLENIKVVIFDYDGTLAIHRDKDFVKHRNESEDKRLNYYLNAYQNPNSFYEEIELCDRSENLYNFINKLRDKLSILNNDEVEKLINALSNQTKVIYDGVDDTFYIIDNLIDLYKAKKDLEFTADPVFTYIIRSLISYRTNFSNSRYASELTSIVNSTKDIENQFKSTFQDYYLYNNYGNIIIIDNKTYISITSYKDNKIGTLLVDYDFNTNTIVDYEYLART